MSEKQEHKTTQIDKFRDLGCDEDEEPFDEGLRKIVKAQKPAQRFKSRRGAE